MAPASRAPDAEPAAAEAALLAGLQALANPVRLRVLRELERPRRLLELAEATGMTRQGVQKHLEGLEAAGLVRSAGGTGARRYELDPTGLFALKERVHELGGTAQIDRTRPAWTVPGGGTAASAAAPGPGLWMVHGDRVGRWLSLLANESVIGRSPSAHVPLPFDPYLSQRHAAVARGGDGWTVTDLHSTNGTRVNFAPLEPGSPHPLRHGDVLSLGRVHLAFHGG